MKYKFLFFFFSFSYFFINAQEVEKEEKLLTQLTPFLSKTYFSVNLGGVFYPFSNDNLKDGYASDKIAKNPFSGRFLLGYKIKQHLSLQFGVLRPASWFSYDNVNNIGYKRSVWVNIWSLSLKNNFQLNNKLSVFAELGAANVARVGFSVNDVIVYSDAHYGSVIAGAGLQYWLNDKWRLSLSQVYIPESKTHNQPTISQTSIGFEYHLKQLPKDSIIAYARNEHFFPKNMIQVSYGNSGIGFGANRFFSMELQVGKSSVGVPVFWVGDSKAKHAFSVTYQRTAFRSKKLFSLDWGVSITGFQTELNKENVLAFSIFPVIRFYLLRTKGFDMYTNYSVIGPTYLTKNNIDDLKVGPNLTYQDAMGLGAFFGKDRKYNFELRIMHYSNGNIFTKNTGIAIPLQFTFGKTF